MLKVYGDEMPFSKDELGGETEKDGSESAKNCWIYTKYYCNGNARICSKSIDGKNENTYIHCILGKFQSWSDGSSHALRNPPSISEILDCKKIFNVFLNHSRFI